MPIRHYCTYFDHRYLSRGLALIESIRRFGPDSRFHILALDRKCKELLDALAIPGVTAIPLEDLEAFDPELLKARDSRSLIEYYFTCTPCFPRYLLSTQPALDAVTYLDADTWFFADPETVFATIGDASIAITPHRFSEDKRELVRYGVFNVGWITWRNDAEGRRCLDDYRADCVAWCHDRLDGDRFADQKYLDKWPNTYGNLCILSHPGINAATWNINGHDLTRPADAILVSGEPLVFWHYHALKQLPDGRWSAPVGETVQTRNPDLMDLVIRPYVTRLQHLQAKLEQRFGAYKTEGVDIRYSRDRPSARQTPSPRAEPATSAPPGGGGYRRVDTDEARRIAAEGWHFEDVAASQARTFNALITQMKAGSVRRDFQLAASAVKGLKLTTPTLLEVGCGSGYYRDVFDHLIPDTVRYSGLDYSPAMIALARETYPDGDFHVGDAARLPFPDRSFDIVFNGVSLMHILDYEAAIQESRRVASQYVILHTAVLRRSGPPVHLVKNAYGRPVIEVILSETELRRLLAKHGLHIVGAAPSISYDLSRVLGEPTHTRTFVCDVRGPAPNPAMTMLNLGCGNRFHGGWVNMDLAATHPAVMPYNILGGIPYPDASMDVVYHSHMLEHLPKWKAPAFLAECARVLRPGGIVRVAIPDLETICRLYLQSMTAALDGDPEAEGRYDWIMMELVDQMVRVESGGEMARHWQQTPLPSRDFVVSRVGPSLTGLLDQVEARGPRPSPPHRDPSPEAVGTFRQKGEVHQWMYDRFSLGRLLRQAGFAEARVVEAHESSIPGFVDHQLDTDAEGRVRKPDSLFMEARRA